MRILFILVSLFIYHSFYDYALAQETIQIYHDRGGKSQIAKILGEKIKLTKKHEVVLGKGDLVNIEILNPNPALYVYEFKKDNLKIASQEVSGLDPLISALASAIGGVPNVSGRAAIGAAPAIPAPTKLNLLIDKLNTLQSVLENIKTAIENSDKVEARSSIVEGNIRSEFENSIDEIRRVYVENDLKNIDQNLGKLLQDVVSANQFPDADGDGIQEPIFEEIFKAYFKTLKSSLDDIQKQFLDPNVKTIITYSVIVGDEPEQIKLSVKKRTDDLGYRDVGDSLIVISIVPFRRTVIEVIPYFSAIYSPNQINFEVKNKVIAQVDHEDFSFRPGAMVVWNVARFGQYKRVTVGPGLGFGLDQKSNTLVNLNIGGLLSYNEIYRLGFGIGMQHYPVGLKGAAAIGGALPADISRIEDVISYSGKLAFMIHFTLVGLKLK